MKIKRVESGYNENNKPIGLIQLAKGNGWINLASGSGIEVNSAFFGVGYVRSKG